ncbi:hypothetical protein M422DRAFT_257242 [Sphaerobolus stellatus SS14]|uniref:HECT-type E3 ubiquitin transferase n=1 Tax=Sphaerobolus stellatus (strain SS14) TaxID=990650 RepID=A0A0C9UYJ8_SPHS4|nr:hypothetical protein M422DRAFT_257242 [Sphaerobolus stellatus SS14]
MKIHARSSKKFSPPHPETAILIATILRTPTESLPDVLSPIETWKWPRSDLHWWIKVLNKFDIVLEEIIRDYDVDKLQVNEFTPLTKKILLSVLAFEKLLLENSTNRKLFNSYDRLSSLLFSADLDVVVADLQLLLRPAQQYSAQASVSHALNISTSRLQALAKRWPNIRENDLEFSALASEKKQAEVEGLPNEASEVNYTFYRKGPSEEKATGASTEGDVFDAQQQQKQNTSAPVTVHLGPLAHSSKSAINILADTVESYSVPNEEKFELLAKIRVARSLGKGRYEERVKLVTIRLLAIAVYCLTQNENTAQTSLFLYEPDLIAQVADFLQLDRGIPVQVQTAAIAALDAMGRYRSKVQELLTAVNAGVNHGILMSLFRKTVTDIANPQSTLPNSFVEALIAFVTFIASHASGGNMVVGAGLIPLLIQIIENKNALRLPIVSKTMQLVDNISYGFPNAFQLFCNARGVDVVVKRIEEEVNLDIEENGENGHLSIPRSSVLKHTLRTLHRMMQTSGTSEGLRGLIDSSLTKSIKKIIEHRKLFGSSVLPIAIHVMSTFVHNEPTSLGVLQEAKLPETFYSSVEDHIEPSIEVIQAIINAIGALCLNQTGQEQFTARPNIIPSIFSIFTSDRHLKVLSEKENAVVFGTAVDELIRHHPSLKDKVFAAISAIFEQMEQKGKDLPEDTENESSYKLVLVSEQQEGEGEAKMEIETPAPTAPTESTDTLDIIEGEQTKPEPADNIIVAFVDVVSRFLEGMFQHAPHCRDFVTNTDCVDRLSRIIVLPCIPYNYACSVSSDSMVQLLRVMTEVAPTQTVNKILEFVKVALDDTKEFWSTMDGKSKLLKYTQPSTPEQLESANDEFRKLVSLYTRVTLLADVFSTYTHGRSALSLVPGLSSPEAAGILANLGSLHRACIWENIVLKGEFTKQGLLPRPPVPTDINNNNAATNAQTAELLNESGTIAAMPGLEQVAQEQQKNTNKETPKTETPAQKNAKALKHLVAEIPTTSLTPFFQCVVKLPSMYSRRNPDTTAKRQVAGIIDQVAKIVLSHLTAVESEDKSASYAYSTVMMGLITLMIFEERSSQSNINTMLLWSFTKFGGMEALLNICRRYASVAGSILPAKPVDRNEELVHVSGGLKVALHLLHILVSSKPLLDSPQTVLITTKDKKETDPDYFEPHNFIVMLRAIVLPFMQELWDAPWLVNAPVSVCKSVVQTMLELMAGENEEPKGDTAAEFAAAMGGAASILHTRQQAIHADENGVQQLCDMGFPRGAATRALTRMRNNVAAAAEYLLAQPLPLPPDPEEPAQGENNDAGEGEAEEGDDDDGNSSGTEEQHPEGGENELRGEDVEMAIADGPDEAASGTTSGADQDKETEQKEVKAPEEWRKELNDAREALKETLGRRSLQLLDEHHSLIFDVKSAFIGPAEGYSSKTLPLIIQDIKDFSPSAYEVHEQPLAIRCRLLALVLNDIGSLDSRLGFKASKELVDVLVALLLAHPANADSETPVVPKWLAPHLLVTEALLVAGDEPKPATLPAEGEEPTPQPVSDEPCYPAAGDKIFHICLKFLNYPDLPQDELIAVMRLLVYLTREPSKARELVKLGGVASLLERFKKLSKETNGCQVYVAIIFRHIIEDKTTLDNIMRQEIKRFFTNPRTRITDVTSFIRNSGGMALRDPKTFVHTVESMCQLDQSYRTVPSVHHISLKASSSTDKEGQAEKTANTDQMQIDEPSETVSNEALEAMLHYLISELMRVGKSAVQGPTIQTPEQPKANEGNADASQQTASEEARAHYLYACFLMQCLTELLFSYNSCKMAFVNYTKKKTATPAKEGTPKHRPTMLNFLISELTSFGTIDPNPNADSKRRVMLCNWAMSVIVALCLHIPEYTDSKDVPADLITVRRLVLDSINRALRDPLPVESIDERYGRLLALSDLCHRLLTVKPGPSAGHKPTDDGALHMAKLMLEKNYVATLTTALAEVDLNYPNVRTVVTSILRPLEQLSKIAIKMGRVAAEKGKDKTENSLEELESEPSDEEVEEEEREETPDLYRNSALGIYGGEMDDHNEYGSDDDMDEDDEMGDEVDMEYGEDDTDGSENTSLDSEAEVIQEDALGVDAHTTDEEGWQDEEDEEDEGVDDEDDEDDEDDDEDAEDEEEDQEIAWEDVGNEADLDDGQAEDMDEEEIMEGMPAGDEGDEDLVSEVDEMADIGLLEHADIVHSDGEDAMGQWFGELAIGRDGAHFTFPGHPRRRSAAVNSDLNIFGIQRPTSSANPESAVHPLLVDPSSAAGMAHGGARGTHRRANRGNPAANAYTDLLRTIEDLVSGGALQLFQQFMTAGRTAPGELHIDLAPIGGQIVTGIDRNAIHRHGGRTAVFTTNPRTERISRPSDGRSDIQDFGPLPTQQRWADEAKMANGKFIGDRVNRLSNHVILALLPAALEAARVSKQKAKEEEEAEERHRKEEEAAAAATEASQRSQTGDNLRPDEQQPQSIENTPARVSTPGSAVNDEDALMEDVSHGIPAAEPTHDVEEAVAGMEGVSVNDPEAPANTSATEPSSTIEASEQVDEANEQQSTEAGPSNANARVTVLINGNPVDITDTGIDPTFLEALPDDMREEVLNQHFRERRMAARQEPTADSQISPEFLDALPPELRAEILQQERAERTRAQAATAAPQNPAQAGPVDIDPASFLASLDPHLRQVVLMDQEDGFLQTLPSHLLAEATGWREGGGPPRRSPPRGAPEAARGALQGESSRKVNVPRDAIQLLDKTGLATLVRLLFFPQLGKKSLLLKIFVNLCENSKTRGELLNLLLNILQDGTGDVAAVDKTFAQLSTRHRASLGPQATPKSASKVKPSVEGTPGIAASWHMAAENVPNLVVQRSLEALTFIVSANEFASRFFLTEHEIATGLKRSASRKGKGKEKQGPQVQYPIVPLLALLDRQTLLKTPSMMDSLAALLATITRPLATLKDKKDDNKDSSGPGGSASTQATQPTVASSNEAVPASQGEDALPTTGESGPVEAPPQSSESQSGPIAEKTVEKPGSEESSQQKIPPLQPPTIPQASLRLIVNILTAGECSARTFQSTLALIQHLAFLADVRDTIAMELRARAQDLGHNIYKDLDDLVQVLERDESKDEVLATIAAKFSPASSDQAKLLRVLKTIDYMYSSKPSTSTAQASSEEPQSKSSDEEKVTSIYESFRFTPLWSRLGDCLDIVEEKPDVEHMATVLLPLIESLMVVCKHVGVQPNANLALRGSVSPRSPTTPKEAIEDLFTSFTDAHRKVLNLMVRNNPSLMSGSFALLVQNPRVLDFDNKRNYFYQQLRRRPHTREHHGTLQLNVRRQRVFEDSFQYLQRKTGEQIKYGKLSVRFYDEEGVDAGGVTREWFQILARQMFNPDYALFQPCAADKLTYQPNRASWVNPEHLTFFKFVGRIIGKAIFDNRLLEAYFARSVYRQLLGKLVDYRDVEWVDPEYYNSLVWILENDPTPLDLTFSTEANEFGVTSVVELKEGGATIAVTNENKREFVQLSAQYRLTNSIKEQLNALLGGFYDVIPKDLISIFNEKEVELLISGTPDIDIDEWRAATEYNGYTSSDPVIVWWWRALKSFNRDERAKVLSFATGTSRVPLGGFGELQGVQGVQRFSIHKAYGDSDRLPQAHTCFNQIDLPQYSSYEKLRQQLLLAVNEGGEGFGFA